MFISRYVFAKWRFAPPLLGKCFFFCLFVCLFFSLRGKRLFDEKKAKQIECLVTIQPSLILFDVDVNLA